MPKDNQLDNIIKYIQQMIKEGNAEMANTAISSALTKFKEDPKALKKIISAKVDRSGDIPGYNTPGNTIMSWIIVQHYKKNKAIGDTKINIILDAAKKNAELLNAINNTKIDGKSLPTLVLEKNIEDLVEKYNFETLTKLFSETDKQTAQSVKFLLEIDVGRKGNLLKFAAERPAFSSSDFRTGREGLMTAILEAATKTGADLELKKHLSKNDIKRIKTFPAYKQYKRNRIELKKQLISDMVNFTDCHIDIGSDTMTYKDSSGVDKTIDAKKLKDTFKSLKTDKAAYKLMDKIFINQERKEALSSILSPINLFKKFMASSFMPIDNKWKLEAKLDKIIQKYADKSPSKGDGVKR